MSRVQARLVQLVSRVEAACDRRGAPSPELAHALAVLTDDHPAGAAPGPGEQRLTDLGRVFGLSALDLDLLTVAVAPELDATFGAVFALLQGDPTRLRPTVGLALELCERGSMSAAARARLAPAGPLRRANLVEVVGDSTVLTRQVRAVDRVVAHLAGEDDLDPLVSGLMVATSPLPFPETPALARALEVGAPITWVHSPPGTAGQSLAAGAFEALDATCLTVDLRRRPPATSAVDAVRAVAREAGLLGVGLVVLGVDEGDAAECGSLLQLLARAPVPVVAVGRRAWDASWLDYMIYTVDATAVGPQERDAIWRQTLGASVDPSGPGWNELVGLRLTPEEIAKTARHAALVAESLSEALDITHIRESARRVGSTGVTGATRARSLAGFDDLILPPPVLSSLHEIVDWATHRDQVLAQNSLAGKGGKGRGITALFGGSPGTGKTLAAHVIAGALGLDLHTVDLSTVVDKYIGETEKNLEQVFATAENLNVVLLFDEADALFGSRSEVRDARDRYANQEVAYLLQRMERFDGIVILATNLRANLDPAFSRRLHFVVHFPDPDVPTRRRLWESHLAALAGSDVDDPVDLDRLAERVPLAGGDIRNIVLAAAYAATAEGVSVGMRHVMAAVEREYRKLGRRLPIEGLQPAKPG